MSYLLKRQNMSKRSKQIETTILELIREGRVVSIRSIGKVLGMDTDDETVRKAIGRAIRSLVDRNIILPKNAGRSRVYVKSDQIPDKLETTPSTSISPFGGIELSAQSLILLEYLSRTAAERTPVGYDLDFLHSYEPNKTFYLTSDQREQLHGVGQVEAVMRPAGTYARNIMSRLLIDLSWNSSRLEGNTYSMLETQRLIELGQFATGKEASEAQMILNHKEAIEYLVDSTDEDRITAHTICSIHALLSENLLGDPAAAGRVRSVAVSIGGSTYIPLENPQVLRECFDLIVEKLNEIVDPFERSLFSIVHLSYLQAFEDVNKRTARLVANIPMVRENLKPLSFADIDPRAYANAVLGIYERNDINLIRDLYVWAYNRSSKRYAAIQQSMGEPNLLKLRYRETIQGIVRSIITERVPGADVVMRIKESIAASEIPVVDRESVFNLLETEIISLHEGNVARFRVRPSEFHAWKELQ